MYFSALNMMQLSPPKRRLIYIRLPCVTFQKMKTLGNILEWYPLFTFYCLLYNVWKISRRNTVILRDSLTFVYS